MYRIIQIVKGLGGILLVLELAIYIAGSAHAGHYLRNSREFGIAADRLAGSLVRETRHGVHWLKARGQ